MRRAILWAKHSGVVPLKNCEAPEQHKYWEVFTMLALRLWPNRYVRDTEFESLLRFLEPYKDTFDEITFMTDHWHSGYYPLDLFQSYCDVLKTRIHTLRKLGYHGVGVNMMVTLGHMNEGEGLMPEASFRHVVGHDGTASPGVYCANDPDALDYVRQKYAALAGTDPEFVWIDDDLRINHKGVPFFCFCPHCVRDFCAQHNHPFTQREELCAALDKPENAATRRQWHDYQLQLLEGVCVAVEQAVHAVNPNIHMGIMTIASNGIARWAKAAKAVKFRPGGGFYDDSTPVNYIHKAFETGLQNAQVPMDITDIQYELDNNAMMLRFNKSVQIFSAECTSTLFNGCTGVIFNCIDEEYNHTLADKNDYLQAVDAYKPVWEAVVGDPATHRSGACRGAYMAVHPLQFGNRERLNGESFFNYQQGDIGGTGGTPANSLAEIGAPLTPDRKGSDVTVLSGQCAGGFSDDELKEFFKGPVMMDYQAVNILNHRGLGEYCGGSVKKQYPTGVEERLTSHAINAEHAGYYRNSRIGFGNGEGYVFDCRDGAEALSELVDYNENCLGVTSYTYQNSLGGRVVVFGYAPWTSILSTEKRAQLLNALDWLRPLPVRILDNVKICPIVRDSGDRRVLMLTSLWCDEAKQCRVALRGKYTTAKDLVSGKTVPMTADGDGMLLDAGSFAPWAFKLIELQ